MKIWVNEQVDPSAMIHACIACSDESQTQECHESFKRDLIQIQKANGWFAQLRWDLVAVNALKIS
jgi:hypothetical protein